MPESCCFPSGCPVVGSGRNIESGQNFSSRARLASKWLHVYSEGGTATCFPQLNAC